MVTEASSSSRAGVVCVPGCDGTLLAPGLSLSAGAACGADASAASGALFCEATPALTLSAIASKPHWLSFERISSSRQGRDVAQLSPSPGNRCQLDSAA